MKNTFDLRKFLTENKLTQNSKVVKESKTAGIISEVRFFSTLIQKHPEFQALVDTKEFQKFLERIVNDLKDDVDSSWDGDFESWRENVYNNFSYPPEVDSALGELEDRTNPEFVNDVLVLTIKVLQQWFN